MKHLESVEELREQAIELELEAKGWEEMKSLLEQEDIYTTEDLQKYIDEHSELKDKVEDLDLRLSSLR